MKMETKAVQPTFLECCQWESQINQDLNGVIEEHRRIHFLDEKRELHQGRFKILEKEIHNLLDDLRTWTTLSMDTKKCLMITSFIDKTVWAWQDAESWIRYEVSQLTVQCNHVNSGYSLHDFAEHAKKSIHGTYRFLFAKNISAMSWHPECIKNFNEMHDVIIPKLSRLLQCDNIFRELNFYKRATPFRQQQLTAIKSFNETHLQDAIINLPRILATPSVDNIFSPLCLLLTGELLGEDPLEINQPTPNPQQLQTLTYPEPLTYQEFKNLPAPVPQTPTPGKSTSDGQGYGDLVNYSRGWEMTVKGQKSLTKRRGPYKKRDKPVVVTCELVKVREPAEPLSPIKIPKLRGNLLPSLN